MTSERLLSRREQTFGFLVVKQKFVDGGQSSRARYSYPGYTLESKGGGGGREKREDGRQ